MSAELVVVLQGPDPAGEALAGAARVARSSERARVALLRSAALTGAELGPLEKDERDAPRPSRGWHWSIAHAGGRVAGVVARQRVGLDLEPVGGRRAELVAAVLDADERALLEASGPHAFVRGWTAKEAVLKKLGVGLAQLSRCRLTAAPDGQVLELDHDGSPHRVHQALLVGCVAAVSVDGPDRHVRWHVEPLAEAPR